MTETEYIQSIKKGDSSAFERVFKMYYAPLCAYAEKYVKSNSAAEEIVQDLFCTMWDKRTQLSVHTSLKAYLYKSVYLNSIQHIRKEKGRADLLQKKNWPTFVLPHSGLESKELALKIQQTLKSLPQKATQMFLLNRNEGRTYKEIAEHYSVSVKTVEYNMGNVIKRLRTSLKDYL